MDKSRSDFLASWEKFPAVLSRLSVAGEQTPQLLPFRSCPSWRGNRLRLTRVPALVNTTLLEESLSTYNAQLSSYEMENFRGRTSCSIRGGKAA